MFTQNTSENAFGVLYVVLLVFNQSLGIGIFTETLTIKI